MSATDRTITLASFLKWETPASNVLLCDGGTLIYDSETYSAKDSVFGSIASFDAIEAGFGDVAESGSLTLAPSPDAALADWWRDDLYDTRIRLWMGEVEADGFTVSSATLLADWLVDTVERTQSMGGQDLLTLELMSRSEKLFLKREGNVCSERFHTSVWARELGFRNCTDLVGYIAWGTANPPRGSTGGGGGGSGGGSFGGFGSGGVLK